MKKWPSHTAVSSFLWLLVSFSFPNPALAGNKALALQNPTQVTSPLATVDDAVTKMYVSDPYTGTSHLAESGVNLLEHELAEINRFIDAPGDGSKKKIVLVRYGVDDPRVMDALIRAKGKNIPVQFVTDLNQSMSFVPKGKEPFSTRFDEAKLSNGEMGKAFKKLLDAGFQFNDPTYGIYSQPLFAKEGDSMIPIMHEKALFLIDESGANRRVQHFHGTANMTDNPRYNRLLEIQDPKAIEYYLAHSEEMIRTFKNGGQISDIKTQPPLRITYKDGTIQEIAFTDGKYNPNDRIASFFQQAVDSPKKVKIKNVVMSHFVLTNRDVVDRLKDAMKVGDGFKAFGVFDDRFIDLDGYGLSPTLQGFDVHRHFGGKVEGVSQEMLDRMNFYAYQSPAIDPKTGKIRPETSTDGPPRARKVWHDKTTYIEAEVEGKPLAYIFTGSLNNSGHFANAEVQTLFVARADSPLSRAFKESVTEVAKSQPQYVIPFRLAVTRNAIAGITGHTDLEVPTERAEKVRQAILDRKFDVVLAELTEQSKVPTQLTTKVDPKEFQYRLLSIKRFFGWYAKNMPPSGADDAVRLRKFAGMALLVSNKTPPGRTQEGILKSVLDRSGLQPGELDQLVAAGWTALKGADTPLPSTLRPPITYLNFDWDNNIMRTGTKLVLFEKGTDNSIEVSTDEYAQIRDQLGKPGQWENYELRRDPNRAQNNTFRRFAYNPNENYFLGDVKKAVKGDPKAWQAPAWKSFVEALKNEETARHATIITAREHHPEEIMDGLKYLQSKGLIKHLPELENIHAVGGTEDPSMLKTVVMRASLAELEQIPVDRLTTKVMNQNGNGWEKLHLWTFSDDDPHNFKAAMETLSADVKAGKFPHVKISLYYTGNPNPDIAATSIVLKPDGSFRAMDGKEFKEVSSITRKLASAETEGARVSGGPPLAARVAPNGECSPVAEVRKALDQLIDGPSSTGSTYRAAPTALTSH